MLPCAVAFVATPCVVVDRVLFYRVPNRYLGGALLVGSDIGSRLSAPSCIIVEPNTVVHCTTPSGTGTGHQWMLNVAGRWSPPSPNRTSFAAPVITSVHPQQVLTSGGTLVINGIGFGATVRRGCFGFALSVGAQSLTVGAF